MAKIEPVYYTVKCGDLYCGEWRGNLCLSVRPYRNMSSCDISVANLRKRMLERHFPGHHFEVASY